MSLSINSLQKYSLMDQRQFATFMNNELLRIQDIETTFIDHYTFGVKYFTKTQITFLFETHGAGFNLEDNKVVGDNLGGLIEAIAFLVAMREYKISPNVNFFITTRRLDNYLGLFKQIQTPLFIIGMPSAINTPGDTAIVGQYGLISCKLNIAKRIDHEGLLSTLSKNLEMSFLEMDRPHFRLKELKIKGNWLELDIELKFNPCNSPTNLVEFYTGYLEHLLHGIDYNLSWKSVYMPSYHADQLNKVILKEIVDSYANVNMKYMLANEECAIFDNVKPCIGIGSVKANTQAISEIHGLAQVYNALIHTNGGFGHDI